MVSDAVPSFADTTTLQFRIDEIERAFEDTWSNAVTFSSLRSTPAKQRLNGWWLDHLPGQESTTGIIGAIVRTAAGRTSTVVDIDAESRRIRTRSGSVYELGIPETTFARNNTRLLRELGLI
ncbi:hypothetical protein [Niveibacterium umoris]|uniref:Uncharacterized protein n=1 Tax=Niveibacterium umoris TaxID=1193620 RepID=A0A840BJ20_9RHOO|nr:hypothetical protein [Niveibacterium umoris]MBB4012980.1 hypothetical protein [Niveibacterium umoris]